MPTPRRYALCYPGGRVAITANDTAWLWSEMSRRMRTEPADLFEAGFRIIDLSGGIDGEEADPREGAQDSA